MNVLHILYFYYLSIIDLASGGSIDWTFENQNITYSYTLELRPSASVPLDDPSLGFVLSREMIEPTVKETIAGITAAIHGIELPRQSSTTFSTQK